MMHRGWRIPDSVFFGLAVAVFALTAGMLIYFYPDLPDPIPSHFGIGGEPDAYSPKNIWSVFFPVMIQALATIGFALLYRHPWFASIPGSVLIDLAPNDIREHLYRILRHSLVVTLVLMNLLFAYIALAIVMTGLEIEAGINGWIIGTLMVLLIAVNVLYTVWFYKLGRAATRTSIRLAQSNSDSQ